MASLNVSHPLSFSQVLGSLSCLAAVFQVIRVWFHIYILSWVESCSCPSAKQNYIKQDRSKDIDQFWKAMDTLVQAFHKLWKHWKWCKWQTLQVIHKPEGQFFFFFIPLYNWLKASSQKGNEQVEVSNKVFQFYVMKNWVGGEGAFNLMSRTVVSSRHFDHSVTLTSFFLENNAKLMIDVYFENRILLCP